MFSPYGEITSVLIKTRTLNVSGEDVVSGFGFVNFKTPEECKKALIEAKRDPQVIELVNMSAIKDGEFLFFTQTKEQRQKFLRSTKENPRG